MLTLRDPVWDTIRLDAVAARIVDAGAFQRLRYIRQLGLAHLVYPGATHTRFDHALGVHHLAQRALSILHDQGALRDLDPADCRLVPLAALLHDIGHYAFSHAVEELEEHRIPGHHEAMAGRFLREPDVAAALESIASDGAARVEALIRGSSDSPLQGLVSGSLDLDKIEYLKRDARFCGVPYGEVDVDRLLHALTLLEDPETGRREVGVTEKGVAALESLLFAKYQMFRNVYWHHAVRAATAMYKRIVTDALEAAIVSQEELPGPTDEALLFLIESRAEQRTDDGAKRVLRLLRGLRRRELPKRAGEVIAAELREDTPADWLEADTPFKRAVEDRLAAELNAEAAFIDYPAKPAMFQLHLLVRRRSGVVQRLGPAGHAGLIGLPQVAVALYRTARVLRLFTLGGRRTVDAAALARVAALSADELRTRLGAATPLLESGSP